MVSLFSPSVPHTQKKWRGTKASPRKVDELRISRPNR